MHLVTTASDPTQFLLIGFDHLAGRIKWMSVTMTEEEVTNHFTSLGMPNQELQGHLSWARQHPA